MILVRAPTVAERYAVEVWVEKSTMNDILEPLARRRNVTLVAGVGDLSATHCLWHVQRVLEHRKPTRVLYISDFDPKGEGMPTGVARKIEYLLRRDGHDLDIRLDPLILTRAQVEQYGLPRIPIKESDKGRRFFEERNGEGAVELDALEALNPGELARIANEAIDRYRDPTRQAAEANERIQEEANAAVEERRQAVLDSYAPEIAELEEDFEAMRAEIAPRQEALATIAAEASEAVGSIEREAAVAVDAIEQEASERISAIEREAAERISAIEQEASERISPIARDASERSSDHVEAINAATEETYQRADELQGRIAAALTDQAPRADDFNWATPEADENPDPLFDSTRDYLTQIDRYKRHQGKPTSRRKRHAKARRVR